MRLHEVARMVRLLIVALLLSAMPLAAEEEVPKVADPTFSPNELAYCAPIAVVITCATEGAIIRWTDDDSTIPSPTVGTIYTEPIAYYFGNHMIRAIAYKPGWKDSEVVWVTFFGSF